MWFLKLTANLLSVNAVTPRVAQRCAATTAWGVGLSFRPSWCSQIPLGTERPGEGGESCKSETQRPPPLRLSNITSFI